MLEITYREYYMYEYDCKCHTSVEFTFSEEANKRYLFDPACEMNIRIAEFESYDEAESVLLCYLYNYCGTSGIKFNKLFLDSYDIFEK